MPCFQFQKMPNELLIALSTVFSGCVLSRISHIERSYMIHIKTYMNHIGYEYDLYELCEKMALFIYEIWLTSCTIHVRILYERCMVHAWYVYDKWFIHTKCVVSKAAPRKWCRLPMPSVCVRPSVCPKKISSKTANAVGLNMEWHECLWPDDVLRLKKFQNFFNSNFWQIFNLLNQYLSSI